MLGVLCSRPKDGTTPKKEKFEVSIGYRYLPSHRHFVGTVEQKQRAVLGTEIVNKTTCSTSPCLINSTPASPW